MKKCLSALLAMALLVTLAACGQTSPPAQTQAAAPPAATQPPQTAPAATEAPTPLLEEFPGLLGEGRYLEHTLLSPERAYLLFQEADGTQTLTIRELSSGSTASVSVGAAEDYTAHMFVLDTGTLALVELTDTGGYVLCLDALGQPLGSFPLPDWQSHYYPVVDAAQGTLWYCDDSGACWCLDLADGSITGGEVTEGWLTSVQDGQLLFTGTDTIFLQDASTRQALSWLGSGFAAYHGGSVFQVSNRISDLSPEQAAFFLNHRDPTVIWQLTDCGNIHWAGPTGTVFGTLPGDGVSIVRAQNPAQGVRYADLQLPCSDQFHVYRCSDNGTQLLLHGFDGEKEQLLLWHYTREEAAETAFTRITQGTLPGLLEAAADRICTDFGITVHTAPDDIPPEGSDYSFGMQAPLLSVYATLLEVERIFRLFPQELLSQLAEPYYTGIDLCQTASFQPINSFGISNAGALTYIADSRWVIVLTAGQPWDLPHELMHIIEDRLYAVQWDRPAEEIGPDYMGYWEVLNPEGFDYFWSYRYDDTSGETGRWLWNWEDNSDTWFVDAYSKTYPKEDRARIFESIFFRDLFTLTEAPHLTEKAAYLCALMKDSFGYETACWERGLDVPPLEHYREAAQAYTDSLQPQG